MERGYFLQNCYMLGDNVVEETLYDRQAMRRFAGIRLSEDSISDETTIRNVRHLLERHGLTKAIRADVSAHSLHKGVTRPSGTTFIDAPLHTSNAEASRVSEMTNARRSNVSYFGINVSYFGIKEPLGIDVHSGITRGLKNSTSKVNDNRIYSELLHGEDTSVSTDKGNVTAGRAAVFIEKGKLRVSQGRAPYMCPPKPGRCEQVRHRYGADQGKVHFLGHQAPASPSEDPLARAAQELCAALRHVHVLQTVFGAKRLLA